MCELAVRFYIWWELHLNMERIFFNLKSLLEEYQRSSITAHCLGLKEPHFQNRIEFCFKTCRSHQVFISYIYIYIHTHIHFFFFFSTNFSCFVSILPCFPIEILSSILHVGKCIPELRDSRKEVEFVSLKKVQRSLSVILVFYRLRSTLAEKFTLPAVKFCSEWVKNSFLICWFSFFF